MSCVTSCVVLRHMVFNSRRFGTLCLCHLHRRVFLASTRLWRWNRHSVPKRRRTTQKVTNCIQNTAKAWNQECIKYIKRTQPKQRASCSTFDLRQMHIRAEIFLKNVTKYNWKFSLPNNQSQIPLRFRHDYRRLRQRKIHKWKTFDSLNFRFLLPCTVLQICIGISSEILVFQLSHNDVTTTHSGQT
jgi:hypothetical protein